MSKANHIIASTALTILIVLLLAAATHSQIIAPITLTKATYVLPKQVNVEYTLSPSTASAGAAFTLSLLSYQLSCAHVYSNKSVQVIGSNIYITYHAAASLDVMCPYIYKPYGPSFSMEALSAGTYKVYVSKLADCMVGNPVCDMVIMPQLAGSIKITATPVTPKWYIEPGQVKAQTDFTLKLLSNEIGNCQTSFTNISHSIQGSEIFLNFVQVNNPEIVCFANISPHGPSYDIKGLSAGNYTVSMVSHAACEFTNPACMIAVMPMVVDTLKVTASLPTVWVEPAQTSAGQSYTLSLWSEGFPCNSVLNNKQVSVQNKSITLTYDYVQTKMACIDVIQPFKVEFPAPRMEAGVYNVYFKPNGTCAAANIACTGHYADTPASTVTVTSAITAYRSPAEPGVFSINYSRGVIQTRFNAVEPGAASISLYTLTGTLIGRESFNISESGFNSRSTAITGLQPGIYGAVLLLPGAAVSTRLLKIIP